MDYIIDSEKLTNLIENRGFLTVSEFARKHHFHRNTLAAYLSGEKSVFCDVLSRLSQVLEIDPINLIVPREFSGSAASEFKELLVIVKRLAEKYESVCFMLIGSQVGEAKHAYSDWDIAVSGGERVVLSEQYLDIKSELEDFCDNFAREVDLVNLDAAPIWFLCDLKQAPMYLAGSFQSFAYICGYINGVRKKEQS